MDPELLKALRTMHRPDGWVILGTVGKGGWPHVTPVMMGVRDSYAQYIARYWLTDLAVDDPTDSAVRIRIWFALRRAGIAMSIPASTVFLTHETPERETRP